MIISGIPYVSSRSDILCSMSASLAMLLSHFGSDDSPLTVAELFGSTFMSPAFRAWLVSSLDSNKQDDSAMMSCALYVVDEYYPAFRADVIESDIRKVALSYIKRRIPVLISGRFPLVSGHTANSVIVKGYVDDYLIVNDPKGNANTGYINRHGENMLYQVDDLERWVREAGGATRLFRLSRRNA